MFATFAIPYFLVLALAGLAGLVVVLLGLRGRREGQEPHCRKCAYDLTGLVSNRCPECGSYLTARSVIRGMPHRRWPLLVCGGVPVVLCAWLLGGLAYAHVRMVNLYRYLPSGRLIADSEAGQGRALYELRRRESENELNDDQVQELIQSARRALDHRPVPIHPDRWLEWLNRWDQQGLLDAEQQGWFREYLARLVIPVLSGPIRVRSGNPLPLKLTHRCLGPFCIYWVESRLSVPDHELSVTRSRRTPRRDGRIWDQDICIDFGAAKVDLEPGRYVLTYHGAYAFYRPERPPLRFGVVRAAEALQEPLAVHEKFATVELEVLPPFDPQQIRRVRDPELDEQIRRSVTLHEMTWYRAVQGVPPTANPTAPPPRVAICVEPSDGVDQAPTLTVHFVLTAALPVDLAFQVLLRVDERDFPLGTVLWPKGKRDQVTAEFACSREIGAGLARVILRADPQAAREAWDVAEIWDGELELGPTRVWDNASLSEVR